MWVVKAVSSLFRDTICLPSVEPCIRLLPASSVTPEVGSYWWYVADSLCWQTVSEQHWGPERIFCIRGQESFAMKLNEQTFALLSSLCWVSWQNRLWKYAVCSPYFSWVVSSSKDTLDSSYLTVIAGLIMVYYILGFMTSSKEVMFSLLYVAVCFYFCQQDNGEKKLLNRFPRIMVVG